MTHAPFDGGVAELFTHTRALDDGLTETSIGPRLFPSRRGLLFDTAAIVACLFSRIRHPLTVAVGAIMARCSFVLGLVLAGIRQHTYKRGSIEAT